MTTSKSNIRTSYVSFDSTTEWRIGGTIYNKIKTTSKNCEFTVADKKIKDQIFKRCTLVELRKLVLEKEDKITLSQVLVIVQTLEMMSLQLNKMDKVSVDKFLVRKRYMDENQTRPKKLQNVIAVIMKDINRKIQGAWKWEKLATNARKQIVLQKCAELVINRQQVKITVSRRPRKSLDELVMCMNLTWTCIHLV